MYKNHCKKGCKKNECCFECIDKYRCKHEYERCFQSEFYNYNISLGYPKICKLYKTKIKQEGE